MSGRSRTRSSLHAISKASKSSAKKTGMAAQNSAAAIVPTGLVTLCRTTSSSLRSASTVALRARGGHPCSGKRVRKVGRFAAGSAPENQRPGKGFRQYRARCSCSARPRAVHPRCPGIPELLTDPFRGRQPARLSDRLGASGRSRSNGGRNRCPGQSVCGRRRRRPRRNDVRLCSSSGPMARTKNRRDRPSQSSRRGEDSLHQCRLVQRRDLEPEHQVRVSAPLWGFGASPAWRSTESRIRSRK